MITLYTITLTVACCVAVALVLGSERRRATESSWATTSTLAVLSASCATLSTLAYAMAGPDDANLVPLVIGDVTMPLCVGLIVATLRRAAGSRGTLIVPAVLISLGVGAVTLFVSADAGQAVKLASLALFSLTGAVVALWSALPPLGARLVGGSLLAYGLYCGVRLIAPQVWSADSSMAQVYLGRGASTIVATVVVGMVAWGTILIIRHANADDAAAIVSSDALTDWIGALLVQNPHVAAVAVSVPDLALHHAAFGRAWAQAVAAAVDRGVRAAAPVGSVVGKVAPGALVALQFGSAVEFDQLRARLQESYETLLPRVAPTDPPELLIEELTLTSESDLRRFARRTRATARRAMSYQEA
ncbi:hypothetical protein [Microbacterium sp. CJ88]|uniref:hypothetical protein n=1 Tax=Microbacterium sp. CJ88 TaxID=3445672 RepID=UPI003F65CE4F